jgi:hypothetical protein
MAKNFSQIIVSTTVHSHDILVDTTFLPYKFIERELGGFPDEKEVILLPGIFNIKFVN